MVGSFTRESPVILILVPGVMLGVCVMVHVYGVTVNGLNPGVSVVCIV